MSYNSQYTRDPNILTHLSRSDPMRITKKFAGASCIGKQVFQPSEGLLAERSEEIQELEGLETLFFFRVGDRSGVGTLLFLEDVCVEQVCVLLFIILPPKCSITVWTELSFSQ